MIDFKTPAARQEITDVAYDYFHIVADDSEILAFAEYVAWKTIEDWCERLDNVKHAGRIPMPDALRLTALKQIIERLHDEMLELKLPDDL